MFNESDIGNLCKLEAGATDKHNSGISQSSTLCSLAHGKRNASVLMMLIAGLLLSYECLKRKMNSHFALYWCSFKP